MSNELSRQLVLEKIAELAFGRCNDEAKLAFMGSGDMADMDKLDLRILAGLHVGASGGVELRLLDRVKLAELLLMALEKDERAADEPQRLITAINAAAQRLHAEADEESAGAVDSSDIP